MEASSAEPLIDEAQLGPPVKGYKAFDRDFICRGMQYEVGKTYILPEGKDPIMCKRGYHFCRFPPHCHNYYPHQNNNRYAEIEAWNVVHEGDKSVASIIRIVKEITNYEVIYATGCFQFGDGSLRYYKGGKIHREDGPAHIGKGGLRIWYGNGQFHREDGPAYIREDGTKIWYKNGQLHRNDGPAIENGNGTMEWYWHHQRHREDGPAIEWAKGGKEWYRNGLQHREDGPAIEWANGDKEWYLNGQLHREDGPAIERADGYQAYYRHGRKLWQ